MTDHATLRAAVPEPDAPTGPDGSRPAMAVLVPLMLVAFIATLDQTIVATALPGIGQALHSIAAAPWIATSYLLTSAVSTLILGKTGDSYGRKRVFQFAVVVFLAGSLICGVATTMGMLIAARALQGIIAARLRLPVHRSQRRPDLAGGITVTLFTTAALLVTVWGGTRYGWGSAPILALIAVAVITLVGFGFIEAKAAEPITPLRLFRRPVFSISCALFFLSTLVLFAGLLYVPELMADVHHYSAFRAGLFLIPLLAGLIAAAGISGSLISRTGHYKVFPIAGALLAGGGMLGVSRLGAASPVWLLAVLLAVAGAGLGFFVQVSVLAGQNAVDYAALGVATGALNFFKTMGGAFGAALFGAILAARLAGHPASAQTDLHGFQTVFFWTVPFMVLALILAIVMREQPLSEEMREVAAGQADVPEY